MEKAIESIFAVAASAEHLIREAGEKRRNQIERLRLELLR
jgi:hypothetical protein